MGQHQRRGKANPLGCGAGLPSTWERMRPKATNPLSNRGGGEVCSTAATTFASNGRHLADSWHNRIMVGLR